MANPAATEANPIQTIENFHKKNFNKSSIFKALDFSNVAIYASEKNTDSDEDFRHFHQMRIFIQNEGGFVKKHRNSSHENILITSNLPERIQYALNSKWEAPLSFGDSTFKLLMHLGVGGDNVPSGTHRATTFRIWTNTEPLTLNLQIPVIDDGKSGSGTNLVEALEILGSLTLPYYNKNSKYGFYIPPPSPLNVEYKYEQVTRDYTKRRKANGELFEGRLSNDNKLRIMVQLGGVLLIDNCIIESVGVDYPNTKALIRHTYPGLEKFGRTNADYLHPLLATVNLRISTVEALTSDTFSKMLWLDSQDGQGTLDASDATEFGSRAANSVMDVVGITINKPE